MDHHVCLERALLTRSRSPDDQVAGVPFDSFRLGPKLNVNAEFASSRYNLADQIGVKARKGTRATLHDSDLRSRTHHHMSKFKGYIPAADKEDSSRKFIKLQELFARRKVLRSRYLQVRWFLSSRNDHIATLQDLLAHLNRRWPDETSATMECRDAGLRKLLFPVFRNGLRKRPLKAHQLLPINLKLLGLNSFAFHSAGPVDDFRSTHKDLLGSHPRSAQVPPNGLESTIATCHPAERHCDAAAEAPDPVPIATRSTFFATLSPQTRGVLPGARISSGP